MARADTATGPRRARDAVALALVAAALGQPHRAAAQRATPAPACAFPSPPQWTALAAPLDGSANAPARLRLIVVQAYIPAGNDPAIPSIDEQRIVLDDGSGYPTEGGILRLAQEDRLPEPRATLVSLPPSLAQGGAMRYLATWVPALKPLTRYVVRIQLPYQRNCVYEEVGSFTTG